MPRGKPVYRRRYTESEHSLSASQIIEENDDSGEDSENCFKKGPRQIIRKVRLDDSSPVFKKNPLADKWNSKIRNEVSFLINKSLEEHRRTIRDAKQNTPTDFHQKSRHKELECKPFQGSKADKKEPVNATLDTGKALSRNEKNKLSSTKKSLRFNLSICSVIPGIKVLNQQDVTRDNNKFCATVAKQNSGLIITSETPSTGRVSSSKPQDEELTPSSPILCSRGKSERTSNLSKLRLLATELDCDDDTECPISSPVLTKKRKPPRGERHSVKRRLIQSNIAVEGETEILDKTCDKTDKGDQKGGFPSILDLLSDSDSDDINDDSIGRIEELDSEEEEGKHATLIMAQTPTKAGDGKEVVASEGKINEPDVEDGRIPESPCTPASQVIDSDEEYPDVKQQVVEREPRFVFGEEDVKSLESGVSITSTGSFLASNRSLSSPDNLDKLSSQQRVLRELVMKSDKKRKPVRGGLRRRLEKSVLVNKSMRTLRCLGVDEVGERPRTCLLFKISEIKLVLSIIHLVGKDLRTNTEYTLVMHRDVLPSNSRMGVVSAGSVLRILPPWSTKQVRQVTFMFGVLQFDVVPQDKLESYNSRQEQQDVSAKDLSAGGDASKKDVLETGENVVPEAKEVGGHKIDMLCECMKENTDSEDCATESGPCTHLLRYLSISKGVKTKQGLRVPESVLLRIASLPKREATCIVELVKRFGGCSATPQSQGLSTNNSNMLNLRVLHPLQQVNRTGLYVDIDIGFIAEDKVGHFAIIKLDSDLIDEPGQWEKFIAGQWTDLIGSEIRVTGVFPQNRIQAHRSSRLAALLATYHRLKQTYIYTLKVYTGSKVKMLSHNDWGLQTIAPDILKLERPVYCRTSMKCVVVYVDEEDKYLLVHSQQHTSPTLTQILFTKEARIPSLEDCPALVTMYGLYVDTDRQVIEHYSACVVEERLVKFCYKDLVTTWTADKSSTGCELVRLIGKIENVVAEECVQWLECGECGSDKILEISISDRICNHCHASYIKSKLRMVVKVLGENVLLLQPTAVKLFKNRKSGDKKCTDHEKVKNGQGDHALESSKDVDEEEDKEQGHMYDQVLHPSMVINKVLDVVCVRRGEMFAEVPCVQ